VGTSKPDAGACADAKPAKVSLEDQLGDREVAYLLEVMELARWGETAALEEVIAAGISVNLTNGVGDTPLILAAYHGRAETVEMLLHRGADHGRLNRAGQTALGCAVFRQDECIVRTLLAAGAEPARGAPSALDVADFFGIAQMAAVLRGDNVEDNVGGSSKPIVEKVTPSRVV
jgi:hypothetical protein